MRCGSECAATRPWMHPRSIRNGRCPLTATWNPSGSPQSERSDRGALTPPADREKSHDEFPSWRTDARGDVVRAIILAVMEADGIDPQELAATLRQTGRMLARRT